MMSKTAHPLKANGDENFRTEANGDNGEAGLGPLRMLLFKL